MMLRSTQLHFAALALAIAAVSLTGPTARAFTMENLNGNPDGSSRFTDPDNQLNNGSKPFGQNGPVVQFGAGSGSAAAAGMPPIGRFQGFYGNPGPRTPEPYAMPLGNGN
jgi:hypothetical protein